MAPTRPIPPYTTYMYTTLDKGYYTGYHTYTCVLAAHTHTRAHIRADQLAG